MLEGRMALLNLTAFVFSPSRKTSISEYFYTQLTTQTLAMKMIALY